MWLVLLWRRDNYREADTPSLAGGDVASVAFFSLFGVAGWDIVLSRFPSITSNRIYTSGRGKKTWFAINFFQEIKSCCASVLPLPLVK